MAWTVYEHITPSGKRYIGITSKENPNRRWRNGKGYHKNTPFGCAIDKYGWNDIQHNILFDDLTEKEAKWLENYLICYYSTFVGFKDDCKGYNMTLGGEGTVGFCNTPWNKGKPMSEESRRKNSEAHKGKTPWNKGKTGVQVAWNKGIPCTEEEKKKISESNKGKNKGKTSWSKGKHLSEEHKRKIGESNKGKHNSEEHNKKISEAKKGKHLVMIDGKRHYE